MLLDISKTKAIKLKNIIDSTTTETILNNDYSPVVVSSISPTSGQNVALIPLAIDQTQKQILFRAVSLANYTENYLTGVIDSDAGNGRNVFIYPGLNESGMFYDCTLNEKWAIVANNNWTVGTNLDKQLAVQSSANYWRVCFVGNGLAILKNNASGGGGGGGGTSEQITFVSNVSVSGNYLVFTYATKNVLVQ